ncbi:MAG TPA: molybdopterin-dependent oxidoreductase, partial [Mycobacteriales bacterium]|nr:molybdopterin-dependent oxidoreductase [Mycobacteriales bacterium]
THFFLSWVIIGSLLIHIAVKLPLIVQHWRRVRSEQLEPPGLPSAGAWSRRGFFSAVGLTVAAVTVTTVGQSFSPLQRLNLFAPRQPSHGPQGLVINRTAEEAGVLQSARSADWRLEIAGPRYATLTLDDLNRMPQSESTLPIACVEGWSRTVRWGGVRIQDLLHHVGAPPHSRLRVISLEQFGPFAQVEMGPEFAADELTLLALRLHGEVLDIQHGYPARIIAPARPGVLQTKWVRRIEVLR